MIEQTPQPRRNEDTISAEQNQQAHGHDYHSFSNFTRWYLNTYYSSAPSEDEQEINKFICKELQRLGRVFDKYVELSCEGALHHAVPFSEHTNSMVLSDFRADGVVETLDWQRGAPHAFNWDHYIEMSLVNEYGTASPEAIEARRDTVRGQIERVMACNILKSPVIAEEITSNTAVGMFFVAECISTTIEEWAAAIKNVAECLPAGAQFFMSAVRGMTEYEVHSPRGSVERYPCACLFANHFTELLPKLGFTNIMVKEHVIENPDVGLPGIIMISATKADS